MQLFYYVLIFFIGACIVSFATVFVSDFAHQQVWSHKRSSCDNCHNQIPFYYTIPIVGYLGTFGKCSKCNSPIKIWYPISELIGGLMLLSAAIFSHSLIWFLPIFFSLALLALSDFQFGYIYSYYYLPLIIPALLHFSQLYILEGLFVYFLMYVFQIATSSIGIADVEVLAILAVLLGYVYAVYILFLACCLCLVVHFFQKKRSYRFIPYLSLATGIVYLIFLD